MKLWTKSLMSRLVVYFLLLLLVTVFCVGAIAFTHARATIRDLVVEQLEVSAKLKEEALNRWLNHQREATISLAQLPQVRTSTQVLLSADRSSPEFKQADAQIQQVLTSALVVHPDELQEILILSRQTGQILFSTDTRHSGQYRTRDEYFLQGRTQTFVQNIYRSPTTNQPMLTISTPLRDDANKTMGVLAVHLKLERIQEIINQTRINRGEQIYCINRSKVPIFASKTPEKKPPRRLNIPKIEQAFTGKSGHALYINDQEIPVIGAYRWLEQWELALLIEIPRSEAFIPAHQLAVKIFVIGLALSGILTLGAYFLARQIARPILAITEAATQVEAGNLSAVAVVMTDDEVGILASAFNRMTRQLRRLYQGLEDKVKQLQNAEIQLKESFEKLQQEKQKVEEHTNQLARANSEITLLNQRLHSDNLDLSTELHVINQQLNQFLEAVPLGIVVIDAAGDLYYSNQVAQQLFGPGAMPNADPKAEIYPSYLTGGNQPYPDEKLPLIRALRGEIVRLNDIEVHQPNRKIPVEAWGTPIYDELGNIAFAIAAFQDISERKKAEAERKSFIEDMFQVNCDLQLALEEEEQLTDAAGRFVPNQFLSVLGYESLVDVNIGDAVQQEMSVLFSDIRNFTHLSEQMAPQDNFKFINAYLSRMEPAILENSGMIDKYIGDGIMALFEASADQAVRAGISMLKRLAEYNLTRHHPGRPPIRIGIGINTGDLMLGIVGGQNRMDTTVVSDAVNLASRLEKLTKSYRVPLLITENTFYRLEDPTAYAIRLIDQVAVIGKSKKVSLFEVFEADDDEIKKQKLATKTRFESALAYYHLQNYQKAAQLLAECLIENPVDPVIQLYWRRIVHQV